MTTPLKQFLFASGGRHVRVMLRLLRCVARDWRTAKELRKSTGMDAGSLRNWLHALVDAKAVRMRHRPHEMQEDGNKPPGPEPREYKLSSKWSDLG